MKCPECKNELGSTAYYCSCGWRKRTNLFLAAGRDTIVCDGEYCRTPAICGIKTFRGWENFCDKHYDLYFLNQARATCARLGLDTTAKQRAYVIEKSRNMFKMREPGEDSPEDIGVQP